MARSADFVRRTDNGTEIRAELSDSLEWTVTASRAVAESILEEERADLQMFTDELELGPHLGNPLNAAVSALEDILAGLGYEMTKFPDPKGRWVPSRDGIH